MTAGIQAGRDATDASRIRQPGAAATAVPFPRVPTPSGNSPLGDIDWGILGFLAGLCLAALQNLVRSVPQDRDRNSGGFDIALAREAGRDGDLPEQYFMASHYFALNVSASTGRTVLAYREWYSAGLITDDILVNPNRSSFAGAFNTVASRSERIHFSLDAIPFPRNYAYEHGGNGNLLYADYYTAWELFEVIQHYCPKTTFYRHGLSTPQPISAIEHTQICSP